MSVTETHRIAAPRDEVWAWHTRPGAVVRLTPHFLPMQVTRQASSLADGTTVFSLPARQRWVARHVYSAYREQECFQDTVMNEPFHSATRWVHTHTFADAPGGGTAITDDIATTVPRRLLTRALAYRQRQLIADFEFTRSLPSTGALTGALTVALTGAGGLVGTALSAQLSTLGHRVIALTRSRETISGQRHWDVDSPAPDLLDGVDAVIHLAGEPIMGRFTEDKKRRIRQSRIEPTARLAQLAADSGVSTFISASAVGFYGTEAGNYEHTERDSRGAGFLADVCQDWEAAAHVDGLRTVNVRTGLALSGAGGLLPLLRLSASLGAGARFGSGDFWMSWVALDDLTDIYIRALVDDSFTGPVNATAPKPVTNAEFSATLTTLLHRPDVLSVPTSGPSLLLGREGASELALADQRIVPAVLQDRGVSFRYPTLDVALAHELGREAMVVCDA